MTKDAEEALNELDEGLGELVKLVRCLELTVQTIGKVKRPATRARLVEAARATSIGVRLAHEAHDRSLEQFVNLSDMPGLFDDPSKTSPARSRRPPAQAN